ncbi:hypothetical protein KEM60_01773 [Austwickia sp. TVS 96-490-7B]|nr:hypothetical protein [Austwickia sp. TVS 96-490-7B]
MGFHPLDGARHLQRLGIDDEIVRLVAWHTGAGFEAEQRGLIDDLNCFALPEQVELDALTMVDLATDPDCTAVLDSRRIVEMLSRYEDVIRRMRPSRDLRRSYWRRQRRRRGDWGYRRNGPPSARASSLVARLPPMCLARKAGENCWRTSPLS